jgi:dTDP-4-amino-4,6-dideoxygalactose transaminase
VRYNYKLTDFQAALGRSQLRRLPAMLNRRTAIADRYRRAWQGLPIRLPGPDGRRSHVYHRFVIAVAGSGRSLARRLSRLGVTARPPVFQPIHMLLRLDGFPGATQAFRQALSIPLYPALTQGEVARVIRAVQEVLT